MEPSNLRLNLGDPALGILFPKDHRRNREVGILGRSGVQIVSADESQGQVDSRDHYATERKHKEEKEREQP